MSFLRRIYSFDFVGHKAWWFTLSGVIIAIGFASLLIRGGGNPLHGLNYGLEFQEGTRIGVAFEESPDLADVRRVVAEAGYADASIQAVERVAGTGTAGFQIQTESLSPAAQEELKTVLDREFTIAERDGSQVFTLETVGATFGRQIVGSSLKAVVIALLLILLYVAFRFQWKFAVGAMVAEVHDILIVIGIYSLTGRDVTTATIAAVLTILGYSLYDTVIIFDRIRENQPKMGRAPYADIVNRSLWQSLTRSLNTSVMSLLPVLCLLFFGGETLKDFAFALAIGIISGAYSTIFVASPVLTILKEREPQYRKLKLAARDERA